MDLRKTVYTQLKHNTNLVNFIIFCGVKYLWETFQMLKEQIMQLLAMLNLLPRANAVTTA
jgi:hypothetical protein